MEVTEEQLKNMSPEQIAELQKKNCIFCQIISGKVPSKKIYEDDKCIGILDINPGNPGHILLLPKKHAFVMPQLSDDEIGHLGMISKRLSHSCIKSLKAEGTTIFIANGAVAGQRAPHFIVHIIPRKENDNLGLAIPEKTISNEEQKQIQQHIIPKVNEMFGMKQMPDDRSSIEKEAEDSTKKPEPSKADAAEAPKKKAADEKPAKEQKQEPKKDAKQPGRSKDDGNVDLDQIAKMFLK